MAGCQSRDRAFRVFTLHFKKERVDEAKTESFVLGAGGTGSLLAELLARQGHTVWCGDRDVERARRFLGKKSQIRIEEANARNLWSIVRAGRGANLIVNASPAVFNEIILRAALRLRAHYMDLNAHLTRNPFKPEQISDVILGCVNQAGEDCRNVARFATLRSGLPPTVPGVTVNRLCASGLQAIIDASRAINSIAATP